MGKKNQNTIVLLLLLFLAGTLLVYLPIKIPYNIYTKGLVVPAYEWSLARTIEGNLISAYKDNIKGSVDSYGVTEFQRGDVVEFRLNPEIYNSLGVQKGDTIGAIYSNEEQRRLIELKGQYDILKAELTFYTTGQKPEDIDAARTKLNLAKQELETQTKLMERSEGLYKDSVISTQDYEIEMNELKVKEISVNIAEAQFQSAITGDKPEQAELIKAKLEALGWQIKQVQERINYFTLISPISGMVVLNRGASNSELLINIVDTSSFVVLAPFDVMEREFVKSGLDVDLKIRNSRTVPVGKVASIDNVVQIVDHKQAVFATAIFNNETCLTPGTFAEVAIKGEEVSILEYLDRVLDLSLSN